MHDTSIEIVFQAFQKRNRAQPFAIPERKFLIINKLAISCQMPPVSKWVNFYTKKRFALL
jgi:hypothetical protein